MAGEGSSNLKILDESECVRVVESDLKISADQFKLVEYKIEVESEDVFGYCGDYFNLIIFVRKNNSSGVEKHEYFVKALPQQSIEQREFVEELGFFKKETNLYTKLLREMDKCNQSQRFHGTCFYARDDILVLENLKKIGFKMKPEDEEFSQKHLEVTLRCMARLHVNSITYEKRTGINIGEKYGEYLTEVNSDPKINKFFSVGLKALKVLLGHHPKYSDCQKIKSFISNNYETYIEKVLELMNTSKQFRNVFCHRDVWDKNILFEYSKEVPSEPVNCILIDFASCRYHPPALDILQFIFYHTTPKIRQCSLQKLLDFYYSCLLEEGLTNGIDISKEIPKDEFFKSCDYLKLVPLVLNGADLPIVLLPKDVVNDMKANDPEGYNHYSNVERSEFLLNYMKTDTNYKDMVFDTIGEFLDYINEKGFENI